MDEDALAAKVREALAEVRRLVPARRATPVLLTVVSSLAEGADRLVAREVLGEVDALLEAPLPFLRERFRRDFETASSRREFDELLRRAATVIELDTGADPEEGYVRVGRYVVDRSDVLLALWDGLPARGQGGTAQIVKYAQERQKPLFWIRTAGHPELVALGSETLRPSALERLDEFNRRKVTGPLAAERLRSVRSQDELSGADVAQVIGYAEADALSAWIFPFLTRADALAIRIQRWFYRLTVALYFAAAAAVGVVAVQAVLFPHRPGLVSAEVVLLVLLLSVVSYGRRLRLHRRWLSYRFLAERFRSAYFLAAAGLGQRHAGGLERIGGRDPAEEWVQRAFTEVWNRRPAIEPRGGVEGLRHFLAERWIREQRRYYAAAGRRNNRRHRLLVAAIYAAFLVTIAAAVPHALGVGEEEAEGKAFSVLSITLPALGAAFSGLLAQREYQRNSDRYNWMQQALEVAETRMRSAETYAAVRRIAADAETTLLEENRDWIGVMRFHDFELA